MQLIHKNLIAMVALQNHFYYLDSSWDLKTLDLNSIITLCKTVNTGDSAQAKVWKEEEKEEEEGVEE